jgi:hypothetical protein
MDTASDNPNPIPVEPATRPKTERRKPVIMMRATEWLAPRWTAIYRFAVLALLAYIAFKPIYVEDGHVRVYDGDVRVYGEVRASLSEYTTVRVSSLPDVDVGSLPSIHVTSLPSVSVDSLPSVSVDSLPSVSVDSLPSIRVNSLPEPIDVRSR